MRALRREQSQGIDLDVLLCSLNVCVTWESLLNYSPSIPLRFSQQLYRLLLSLFGLTRVEAAWEFVGKTKLCVGCVLGCRVFNRERRIRLARAAFAKSRQQNVSGTFSLLVWCSPAVQIQHGQLQQDSSILPCTHPAFNSSSNVTFHSAATRTVSVFSF